jgi:hypothetical protein
LVLGTSVVARMRSLGDFPEFAPGVHGDGIEF